VAMLRKTLQRLSEFTNRSKNFFFLLDRKKNEDIETRSTGTVHTSTNCTSYQCRDTDTDPNCHQNLIICSSTHCQPSLQNFLQIRSEVFCAKLLVDKRTNNDDYNLHILLGGGNDVRRGSNEKAAQCGGRNTRHSDLISWMFTLYCSFTL